MIESGSSLSVFLTCPRKYDYQYNKRLEPKGYPSALVLGSLVHAAVEGYTSRGPTDIVDNPAPFMRARSEAMERFGEENHSRVLQQAELANGMYQGWRDRWDQDEAIGNRQMKFVHSELEWKIKIGPHLHVGKSDGVVKYKDYEGLFLYELKTAADRDRETYRHRLEIDKQISSNIMGLMDQGLDIKGVIYDVMWKPPLRGRKDETPDELNQRIVETMKADPDSYERFIVYRNDSDLQEHIHDLAAQYHTIDHAGRIGHWYRNTGACDNYGSLCPFFQICMENKSELEELYAKRDKKLPELSKELQNAD